MHPWTASDYAFATLMAAMLAVIYGMLGWLTWMVSFDAKGWFEFDGYSRDERHVLWFAVGLVWPVIATFAALRLAVVHAPTVVKLLASAARGVGGLAMRVVPKRVKRVNLPTARTVERK